MHSHWGFVFCVFGKGGKYVRGPRERGGEGEGGREGVLRNDDDGGKYECERKVMEGFDSFDFVLPSPSSRVYQQIATYIICC